MPCARELRGCA